MAIRCFRRNRTVENIIGNAAVIKSNFFNSIASSDPTVVCEQDGCQKSVANSLQPATSSNDSQFTTNRRIAVVEK